MSDGHGNPPPSHPQEPAPHVNPPGAAVPGGGPAPGPHGQQPYPPTEPWSGGAEPFGRQSSSPGASTWFALASIVAIVAAVSVKESDRNGWDDHALWAGFAIACAVALLAPVARGSVNLSETRAWQVAAGGAAGLGFFWILFVLPSISRNVSFVATLGTIAAGLSVWSAPGRPQEPSGERSTW